MNCQHREGQTECQQCHPLQAWPPLWPWFEQANKLGHELPLDFIYEVPEPEVKRVDAPFYQRVIQTIAHDILQRRHA
jgi:hypothetical protein